MSVKYLCKAQLASELKPPRDIFIAPKASAEGACIWTEIGYCGACMLGYYELCMKGYYEEWVTLVYVS